MSELNIDAIPDKVEFKESLIIAPYSTICFRTENFILITILAGVLFFIFISVVLSLLIWSLRRKIKSRPIYTRGSFDRGSSTFLDPTDTSIYKSIVYTVSGQVSNRNKISSNLENRRNEFELSNLPPTITICKLKCIHENEREQLIELHKLELLSLENKAPSAPEYINI